MKSNLARVFWSSRAKDDCSMCKPPSQNFFGLVTEFILFSRNCGGSAPMPQHDPHFTLDARKKRFRELKIDFFGWSKFKWSYCFFTREMWSAEWGTIYCPWKYNLMLSNLRETNLVLVYCYLFRFFGGDRGGGWPIEAFYTSYLLTLAVLKLRKWSLRIYSTSSNLSFERTMEWWRLMTYKWHPSLFLKSHHFRSAILD